MQSSQKNDFFFCLQSNTGTTVLNWLQDLRFMAHRNHFKDYRKSKNINTSTDYIERVQSYYYKNENASSNLKSNQNNEVL